MMPPPPTHHPALAWIGLLLLLGLGLSQSAPLRAQLREAVASRAIVVDDEGFYRAHAVLGPEMVLLEAVRAKLPPGTPIAVSGEGVEGTARRQRFWLALLPQYPVTLDAETEICPRACATPGREILAEGDAFVWIRRPKAVE